MFVFCKLYLIYRCQNTADTKLRRKGTALAAFCFMCLFVYEKYILGKGWVKISKKEKTCIRNKGRSKSLCATDDYNTESYKYSGTSVHERPC
jgi:hypothetical protein